MVVGALTDNFYIVEAGCLDAGDGFVHPFQGVDGRSYYVSQPSSFIDSWPLGINISTGELGVSSFGFRNDIRFQYLSPPNRDRLPNPIVAGADGVATVNPGALVLDLSNSREVVGASGGRE